MAELTRKAQIAAGAAITPLTPGEKVVKNLAGAGGTGATLPAPPTAQGNYKLSVDAKGELSWTAIV